ncbi:hypothetical protein ACIRST_15055 [Kitasatospora sp. NPDC101447]|uniref:hypothetical protein n=1 Tax=Kitasatospora sp. NPDC101447 TaxID=3364102 RepID=UPI0038066BBA
MSVVKINIPTAPAEHREVLEKRFASESAHQHGGDGEAPKRPAASGSTLWSFGPFPCRGRARSACSAARDEREVGSG